MDRTPQTWDAEHSLRTVVTEVTDLLKATANERDQLKSDYDNLMLRYKAALSRPTCTCLRVVGGDV